MRTVIGLAGVKTSGKSTVADMVRKYLGDTAKESALANKLKDVSAQVFEVPRSHFDDQSVKEVPFETGPRHLTISSICKILDLFSVDYGQRLLDSFLAAGVVNMPLETPRKIAQIVGTEVLRATGDEDIHCKNMPMNDNGVTIVSDLRFPNEFSYFNDLEDINFVAIYVQRDEAESVVTEDSHPSEKCVFEFSGKCVKLDNNGTFDELDANVLSILKDSGLYKENNSKEA